MSKLLRSLICSVFLLILSLKFSYSQTFSSGPIIMCDTSYFTATVSGIGWFGSDWSGGAVLDQICIDITSDHPQNLSISLTSPAGITLLLSAFNGGGGSDYTACCFQRQAWNIITNGSAPFSGGWIAQGGSLNIFDNSQADGTWKIAIIDTTCQVTNGSGGPYINGTFNGSAAGGISVGYIPPPCMAWIPDNTENICSGESVDMLAFYSGMSFLNFTFYLNGNIVADPSNVSTPGSYNVWAYDNWTGCSYSATYVINSNPKPSLGNDQIILQCQGTGVDLTNLFPLSGVVSQSWTLNNLPISINAAQNASTAGTYEVIASNAPGCSDTAIVNLNINGGTFLGSDTVINNCSLAQYDLTSVYSLSGLTASWFFNSIPVANPANVSQNGTYLLIATNAAGCKDSAEVSLTLGSGSFLGTDQIINTCGNATIDLNTLYSSTGLTYAWSLNNVAIANPSSINASGTYQLIAVNASGCRDTALADISFLAPVLLGNDQSVSICANENIDLTSYYTSIGLTADWTLNGNVVSNPSSVNTTGSYCLIASNSNGCTDTAYINLNILAVTNLGTDQVKNICSNSSLDLNTLYNTSGLSSNWSLNSSSVANTSSVNTAGTYQLIIINSDGCRDTADVTVNSFASPALGIDKVASSCSNQPVNLNSFFNLTGLSANWKLNNSSVTNSTSVNASGLYELIATNSNGCSDSAAVNLNIFAAPALGADQSYNSCGNIPVDLSTLYNTQSLIFSWTTNGIAIPNISSVNITGVYQLIVENTDGCSDTAIASLSFSGAPALGSDQSVSTCSNIAVNLSSYYNSSGLTSAWTINNIAVPDPSSVNTNGTYQLIATDINNCRDTALINLQVFAAPQLGVSQNHTICSDSTLNLTSLYNNSGYIVYNWTFNNTAVTNQSAINSGGTYQLIVENADLCYDTAEVNLNVLSSPVSVADQFLNTCSNVSVDLTAIYNTAGNSVSWTHNNSTVADPGNVNDAGDYYLTVVNQNGCSADAKVNINVKPAPQLGSDQTINICSGTATDLTILYSTNGLTAEWKDANGINLTNPSSVAGAGYYQLIASNSDVCSDTANVDLKINQSPSLGSDQNFSLCQWMNLDLSSVFNINGLNATYSFNGTVIQNISAVHDSGLYLIQVSDLNGCTDEAYVSVSNAECRCIADFDFVAECMQEPVTLKIIADSTIISAHWHFDNPEMAEINEINPIVKFLTDKKILVTLIAELSCGTDTVKKYIQTEDCSQSCEIYIPMAFTPNDDGLNDILGCTLGNCIPEEFKMVIFNRFGKLVFESTDPFKVWDGKFEGNTSGSGLYFLRAAYKLPYQKGKLIEQEITLIR